MANYDSKLKSYINSTVVVDARALWKSGKYAAAWAVLANAGDRYADNAAEVLSGVDPFTGTSDPAAQFFQTLVKEHWTNTVGATVYAQYENAVAGAHLDNYLTELCQRKVIMSPFSQIEMSPK